jgi:hypothetical protein
MKKYALLLLLLASGSTFASEQVINMLRSSRSGTDYILIYSCASSENTRRYEVTASDQEDAKDRAVGHLLQSQWCSSDGPRLKSVNQAR